MSNFLGDVAAQFGSTQFKWALAAVIVVTLLVRWWRSRSDPLKKYLASNPPKDKVILHQYGKASTVPSISPFVMKLETYLRVAKIPYVNKYSRLPGPKGKLPWIQYNDQVVSDSQICIQFLNTEKNVDLNKRLTTDQVTVGHLIRRTAEESLYWCMVTWRLIFETSGAVYRKLGLPKFLIWYLQRTARTGLWTHGIGRYSQQEVTQIMEDDLSAVSKILGDKKFLFGNTVCDVTEFDCALFGQLCQLVWQMPGTPIEENIAQKYPNLVKFCENMKTAFWPDWEDRIMHPLTKTELTNHSGKSVNEKLSRHLQVTNTSKTSKNVQASKQPEYGHSRTSDSDNLSRQVEITNQSRKSNFKQVQNIENGMTNSTKIIESLQTIPKNNDIFDRSGKSTPHVYDTSSNRTQGLVHAFNGDFRKSVLNSYSEQVVRNRNQTTALRSRKLSASTILAHNGTILPAQ